MSGIVIGMYGWGLTRDDDGFREYFADWQVRTNDYDDGPQQVMSAAGLPITGSYWEFGNDSDPWCFCRPGLTVESKTAGEGCMDWKVRQIFSNKPLKRCQDASIESPLLEPYRISGSFGTYTIEATHDYQGNPLKTTSHELLRGSVVEKDDGKTSIQIGFNVSTLPLSLYASTLHKLNDSTLWGLPKRCIKLSEVRWERLLYGTCSFYYSIDYSFDIDYNTFDRSALDMGTKVLADGGDSNDPRDWRHHHNKNDDIRDTIIFDADGNEWDGSASPGPGYIPVRLYGETNLLALGIPSSL